MGPSFFVCNSLAVGPGNARDELRGGPTLSEASNHKVHSSPTDVRTKEKNTLTRKRSYFCFTAETLSEGLLVFEMLIYGKIEMFPTLHHTVPCFQKESVGALLKENTGRGSKQVKVLSVGEKQNSIIFPWFPFDDPWAIFTAPIDCRADRDAEQGKRECDIYIYIYYAYIYTYT